MDITGVAALVFGVTAMGVIAFQAVLALGAPWGAYATVVNAAFSNGKWLRRAGAGGVLDRLGSPGTRSRPPILSGLVSG